eukprot:755722-Hanusia_phi.AAC.1
MSKNQSLNFKGCSIFRYRIIAATLTGKAIRISDIRSNTESPGLRDFEASFLRMIEKLSNGCMIEINDTGTKMRYKPGVLVGGSGLEHDCGKTRGEGLAPVLSRKSCMRQPVNLVNIGHVRRVRGVAYASKVAISRAYAGRQPHKLARSLPKSQTESSTLPKAS